ncbi:MAG: hypothetical protein B6U78_01965 [Candidatus Aenigmarchaeota archaeon ex4484_224]|nr:MAG: hypothetical protein B6U78_01965 [Candidatus Aenigmarchaeota archaeon ex4484_224]
MKFFSFGKKREKKLEAPKIGPPETPQIKEEIASSQIEEKDLRAKIDLLETYIQQLKTQNEILISKIERIERMVKEIYEIAKKEA